MGQISEESADAHNCVKNLIEVIVGEVMKTVNERTEPHFDSFENLKLQSFGNEEILAFVKSEGIGLDEIKQHEITGQASINDSCYQNLPEVCIHSSTLSTQGEGDFQPPFVRETKAFYNLGSEGISGSDTACVNSSNSSINTSFTEELITQLHCDINDLSFDNVHLSGSEVEKELLTKENGYEEEELSSQDGEEMKRKINQSCQTISANNIVEDVDSTNEQDNHELRQSPKFSQLDNLFSQYFKLSENCNEKDNEEERGLLSTSSDELVCTKCEEIGSVDKFSQTNPFRNPFFCSNVNSTIALSSDCCETRDVADELSGFTVFADVEENRESNEWVEANEVEIRITEPGCSKDFLQSDNLDDNAVQTRQYWSNVGLITEYTVDRRNMGPVEIPGIESIKGIRRVEETYLTHKPEQIIWVTEAETEDENITLNTSEDLPMDKTNYLQFPEITEGRRKKKKFVSRLTKAISSIFKLNRKESKE